MMKIGLIFMQKYTYPIKGILNIKNLSMEFRRSWKNKEHCFLRSKNTL